MLRALPGQRSLSLRSASFARPDACHGRVAVGTRVLDSAQRQLVAAELPAVGRVLGDLRAAERAALGVLVAADHELSVLGRGVVLLHDEVGLLVPGRHAGRLEEQQRALWLRLLLVRADLAALRLRALDVGLAHEARVAAGQLARQTRLLRLRGG